MSLVLCCFSVDMCVLPHLSIRQSLLGEMRASFFELLFLQVQVIAEGTRWVYS